MIIPLLFQEFCFGVLWLHDSETRIRIVRRFLIATFLVYLIQIKPFLCILHRVTNVKVFQQQLLESFHKTLTSTRRCIDYREEWSSMYPVVIRIFSPYITCQCADDRQQRIHRRYHKVLWSTRHKLPYYRWQVWRLYKLFIGLFIQHILL